MHHHLLHARHVFFSGWLLLSPAELRAPLPGGFELVLTRESPLSMEHAAPPRYATPAPELRGAVILRWTWWFR